jgi:hypothetical protein
VHVVGGVGHGTSGRWDLDGVGGAILRVSWDGKLSLGVGGSLSERSLVLNRGRRHDGGS